MAVCLVIAGCGADGGSSEIGDLEVVDVRTSEGPRVRVPERDPVAPTARLRLDPGEGGAPVVTTSPSSVTDRLPVVSLPRPAFRATAVARDAEGGTGRIRLSIAATTRCGEDEHRRVRYLPPAQIASVALPPGAKAPAERTRSALVRLPTAAGCSVTGELWAEATDAHGRQAVARHIGFRHP